MIIRRADLSDVPWIIEQLPLISKAYETDLFLSEDANETRDKVVMTILDHLIFVALGEDGNRVGFIAGLVSNHLYNQKVRVLTQLLWWVTKENRNSMAGGKLLDMFVAWGRANCNLISLNLMTKTPIKVSTLTKRGFVEKERNYIMEIS